MIEPLTEEDVRRIVREELDMIEDGYYDGPSPFHLGYGSMGVGTQGPLCAASPPNEPLFRLGGNNA